MQLFYCGSQWGYMAGNAESIPSICLAPLNLTASVRGQFVLFLWTAPHPYASFTLEYKRSVDNVWTTVTVNGTSYQATLGANMLYNWRVKTNCTNTSSDFVVSTVTTLGLLPGCSVVNVNSISFETQDNGNVKIMWGSTGASLYKVRFYNSINPGTTIDSTRVLIDLIETTGLSVLFYPRRGIYTYELTIESWCNNEDKFLSDIYRFTIQNGDCGIPIMGKAIAGTTTIFAVWFANNLYKTSYNIFLNGVLVFEKYLGTNFTFSNLTPGTFYNIKVLANCGDTVSGVASIDVKTQAVLCDCSVTNFAYNPNTKLLTWANTCGADSSVANFKLVINNGSPIVISNNVFQYLVPDAIALFNFMASLHVICASGSISDSVSLQYENVVCATPTDLVLTQPADDLLINFKGSPKAIRYIIQIASTSVNNTFYTNVPEYALHNLVAGDTFTVTVSAECKSGTSGSITGIFDATPPKPIDYNIDDVIQLTSNSIEIDISKDTTKIYTDEGRLIVKNAATSTVIHDGPIGNDTSYIITTPAPLPIGNITISAFAVDARNAGAIPAGTIVQTFPLNSCNQPLFTYSILGETQIALNLSNSFTASQTKALVKWKIAGREYNEGIEVLKAEFPKNITVEGYGRYKFLIAGDCNGEYMEPIESNWICPPTASVQVAAYGNGIRGLILPHILGDFTLKIKLTALGLSEATYSSNTNEFIIPDLLPNYIYAGEVSLACDDYLTVFSSPINFTIQTKDKNDLCSPASIAVYKEDYTVDLVNQSRILVSIDHYDPAYLYDAYLREVGSIEPFNVLFPAYRQSLGNTILYEGLAINTNYEIAVRKLCGNLESDITWREVPSQGCLQPKVIFDYSSSTFTIMLPSGATDYEYTVDYKNWMSVVGVAGGNNLTIAAVNAALGNYATVNTNQVLDFKFRTVCGSASKSGIVHLPVMLTPLNITQLSLMKNVCTNNMYGGQIYRVSIGLDNTNTDAFNDLKTSNVLFQIYRTNDKVNDLLLYKQYLPAMNQITVTDGTNTPKAVSFDFKSEKLPMAFTFDDVIPCSEYGTVFSIEDYFAP